MIIEEKVKDLVVVGEDTSKKAKISQDKLAKLQYLLTKGLYKDPITAVIAEWTNNGIDSVVQAGKNPIDTPVIVSIGRELKGQYIFRVEDRGTGLDDRDFEDICMNYLESTKEEDNDTIGHFGIGMKSFLSLERSATFTCRKNGLERKYVVYEGAEFVNFDLVYCKDTTEENGVIAELVIADWNERYQFDQKARAKLAYYDTVVLLIDNVPVKNEIYRNELFQFSTLAINTIMHLCLKDVYYAIDFEALGIPTIYFPVAIRLGLGDGLTPTPSRESYITNAKTKELILGKIKDIADWFIDRYNETVKEFPSFMDGYDYIGNLSYFVRIDSRDFGLVSIKDFSKKQFLQPKVKGIKLRKPDDYKFRKHDLFKEYGIAGYLNHSDSMQVNTSRMYMSIADHVLAKDTKGKTVLVSDSFRGNVKNYLKSKYTRGTLFIKRNSFEWKLGKKKEVGQNGQMKINTETYRYILDLVTRPRADWRPHIEEWNFVMKSITDTFKDETKVADTKEFADWVEAKKQKMKLAKGTVSSTYAGLNKQVGDVTMAYSYRRYGKIHFKKEAIPIASLEKNKFLTVLLDDDDNLDLAKEIVRCMQESKSNVVKFAVVGKKERTKIPEHFQFINFKKFMSRDCKPFMRIASAIKFKEVLSALGNIKNYKNPVFAKALKFLSDDENVLKKYVDSNFRYGLATDIENIIIDVADEHKLYDQEFWDVYKRLKENTAKYDFITLIHVPSSTNAELTQKYETLVNQILLFRKKFYNDLQGAKIVFEDEKQKAI